MSAPKSEGDPAFSLLLFLCVFGIMGWIVWYFLRVELLTVMRYVRLGELGLIGLFTHDTAACFNWLRQAPIGNAMPTVANAQLAGACFGAEALNNTPTDQAVDYYNLSGHSLAVIGRRTASYFHWPFAAIAAFVGFYAIFITKRNKFRTKYTLESFIKVQAKMWPVISPIVDFKPAQHSARIPGQTVPDKIPPFAESFSPEEWIAWHRIAVTNGIPDREATRRAFVQQLGPRWQGLTGQPLYVQSLIAAFALKGVQKREESDDLLGRISVGWSEGRGFQMASDLQSEIMRLVRDPAIGGEAEKIAALHAYRTTALLGVLRWARWMGGVLAPAQFLWVRPTDRALWYPLNNLGRRTFHTEGAGAMAHFMAEQNAKKPLPIPRVDTAIITLNQHLASAGLPIPPREEPGAKTSRS